MITLIQTFQFIIIALVFVCIILQMLRMLYTMQLLHTADEVFVLYHGEINLCFFTCMILMRPKNFC